MEEQWAEEDSVLAGADVLSLDLTVPLVSCIRGVFLPDYNFKLTADLRLQFTVWTSRLGKK